MITRFAFFDDGHHRTVMGDKRITGKGGRPPARLDVGVETILVDMASLVDDMVLRTDPVSGATLHLLTIEIARRR